MEVLLKNLLMAAGIGQLLLVVVSFWIPRILGWERDLAKLPRLTRRVFWVYAGYIVSAHIIFALAAIFGAELLVRRDLLAGMVNGFVALWWWGRIGVQFFCFQRSDIAEVMGGSSVKWVWRGYGLLGVGFCFFAGVYSLLVLYNGGFL